MADSILPWLSDYLISTGEQFGARLPSIPKASKRKKVQLIEFLTYGSETEDAYIWAVISDKNYHMPIRFSKEAVADFNKLNNKRITQSKTAIITIQKFRPFLSRIPIVGKSKMSLHAELAMDCDAFTLVGSSGEGVFGNPKPVSQIPDISAWTAGLCVAGGDGNILMQRKKDREAQDTSLEAPKSNQLQQIQLASEHYKPTARKVASADGPKKRAPKNRVESLVVKYENSWRSISKDPALKDKTEQVALVLKNMAVVGEDIIKGKTLRKSQSPVREASQGLEDVDSSTDEESCRSATPIEWSLTEAQQDLAAASQPGDVSNHSSPRDAQTSPPPSTPARKQPSLLGSSPPPSSLAQIPESSMVSAHHQHVVRKVPRPPQPTPVKFVAGIPARILVPNSDTSVAASQSQSKSQPKDSSQAIYISQSGDRLNAFPPDGGSKSPSVSRLDDEETNYDGDRSSPFNNDHSATNVAMTIVSPLDGDCVPETSDMKPAQMISMPNDQRKGSRLKDAVVQEPSGLQLGVLEEDDVQTHVLLSGSAVPPTHAVLGENEPEPPASPVHENGLLGGTQGVRVSCLATPANLGNKVQEPVNKAHGSSPGTVEHDPIAWAAPTFSREPNAIEFPSRSASKQPKAKVAHSTSREQTNTWGPVRGRNETSCRSSERPEINPARERDASMIVRAPLTAASRALGDPASIMPSNKSLATTLNQQQDTPNKKSDSRKVGEAVQQTAVVSRVSVLKEEGGKTSTPLRLKRTRVGSDGGADAPAKQRKYDHPVKPLKGKLSGLEVVHMDYLPLDVDGPPRLDWMQLRDILLRTGRDRAQAEDGLDVH